MKQVLSNRMKIIDMPLVAAFALLAASCGSGAGDAPETGLKEQAAAESKPAAMTGSDLPSIPDNLSSVSENEIVKARQAIFKSMGKQMKPLGAMARGKAPVDGGAVSMHAVNLAELGRRLEPVFAIETPNADAKTEAAPIIWSEMADFNAKREDLIAAALVLKAAGETGDEGAIKKAIGGVGGTCKSCHDDYRIEK